MGRHERNARGDTHWRPGHQGSRFDPEHWLRPRDESEFDPEDIGALAVPRPSAREMSDAVRGSFSFLADLDEAERMLAKSDPRDRAIAIRALSKLPNTTFDPDALF